jgi:hypothetical protein
MGRSAGGRPQALRAPQARLAVIEAVLDTGSVKSAATAIGAHERSIQRYAQANPWFDRILTAALARAERIELLAALEQRAAFEAGERVDEPPLFEPVAPPRPVPAPPPTDPEILPTTYTHVPTEAPASASVTTGDQDCQPGGAHAAVAAGLLGVDADLVVDQDRDLSIVGLPTTGELHRHFWTIAKDKTHPACAAINAGLLRIASGPILRAQAARDRREFIKSSKPVIDAEATAADVGLVVLVLPAKDPVV